MLVINTSSNEEVWGRGWNSVTVLTNRKDNFEIVFISGPFIRFTGPQF
jgi:hypothetical protein